jgi:hypothetical protein
MALCAALFECRVGTFMLAAGPQQNECFLSKFATLGEAPAQGPGSRAGERCGSCQNFRKVGAAPLVV